VTIGALHLIASRLRRSPAGAEHLLLLVTAREGEDDAVQASLAGIADHVALGRLREADVEELAHHLGVPSGHRGLIGLRKPVLWNWEWTRGNWNQHAQRPWRWSSRSTSPSQGVRDGGRVALLATNCLEWLAMYYGAFRAGAVPVSRNFRLQPSEWMYRINDAGARALLAQAEYVAHLDRVRNEIVGTVASFVSIDGESSGWIPLAELLAADAGNRA
jgi:hypothetical protein